MMPTPNTNDEEDRGVTTIAFASLRPETGYVPLKTTVVATFVSITSLLWLGITTGTSRVATVGVIIGATLAVALAVVDHNQVSRSVLGGVMLLSATGAAIGLPIYYVIIGNQVTGGIGIAGVLTGIGVMRFQVDAIGDGAVARAIAWVLRVAVVTGITALLMTVIRIDIAKFTEIYTDATMIGELIVPTTQSSTVIGFVAISWLALVGIWLAIGALPPSSVLPASRRQQYQILLSRTVSMAVTIFGVGGIVVALFYILISEVALPLDIIEPVILSIAESSSLRTALIRVFATGILITILLRLARSLGATILYGHPVWLPSGILIAGGLIGIAYVGTEPAITTARTMELAPITPIETAVTLVGATTVGLFAAFAVLFVIGGGLLLFPILSGLGLLPTSTVGPRLVLLGLVIGAIVGTVSGAATSTVFASVVAAIVVWDIAEYGIRLTTDIGLTPAHRDGELVHAAGSLLVGSLGFGWAIAVHRILVDAQGSEEGILITVTLATITIIFLAIFLRN